MESGTSFTGFDGLCPTCEDIHISLTAGRGFYVRCGQIDKMIKE